MPWRKLIILSFFLGGCIPPRPKTTLGTLDIPDGLMVRSDGVTVVTNSLQERDQSGKFIFDNYVCTSPRDKLLMENYVKDLEKRLASCPGN